MAIQAGFLVLATSPIFFLAFCPKVLPSNERHCLTLPNCISMLATDRMHSLN